MRILLVIYLFIALIIGIGLEIIFSEKGIGRKDTEKDPIMKWVNFDHPIMHILYFICSIGWFPIIIWYLINNDKEKPRF